MRNACSINGLKYDSPLVQVLCIVHGFSSIRLPSHIKIRRRKSLRLPPSELLTFYRFVRRQQKTKSIATKMSIPQGSGSLRTWKRLSFQLHALKPISSIRPGPSHTATTITTTTTTSLPQAIRQFHNSHLCNAARSPSIRRAKPSRVVQPAASREPISQPVQGTSETRKKFLDQNGPSIWAEAVKADVLDEKIELVTFMRIAYGLYERAYTTGPSAEAIWELDPDADKVFNIGQIASVGDPRIKEWLLTSCALADARMPVLICASRYMVQHKNKTKSVLEKTPLLERVESFALRNNGSGSDLDAVAMTLHAQALGLRGRYSEAIPVIEQVMQVIKPEASPPTLVTGGFLSGFTPPWEVCEWLKRETGDHDGAAEVVKLAATEYHEPKALVAYANHVVSDKGDFETFEECMSKAASAGNPEACQKLADFYLLISIGRYPRRGDGTSEQHQQHQQHQQPQETDGKGNWLTNLFNRSLSRSDYRKLAREWYELACLHGSHEAALTFSLILRAEGDYVLGKHYLDLAAQKTELLPVIRSYRVNWENRELDLPVDYKRLEVC